MGSLDVRCRLLQLKGTYSVLSVLDKGDYLAFEIVKFWKKRGEEVKILITEINVKLHTYPYTD